MYIVVVVVVVVSTAVERYPGQKARAEARKRERKGGGIYIPTLAAVQCSAVHGRTGQDSTVQDRYIYLERWLVVFARRRREDGVEEWKRGVNVGVGVNGMWMGGCY